MRLQILLNICNISLIFLIESHILCATFLFYTLQSRISDISKKLVLKLFLKLTTNISLSVHINLFLNN